MCANHCISECFLCLLFLHVYHSGDTLEYLDCAMSSTPSNYKSVQNNHSHGDEDHDPRSDLSQGRGDEAEHPTIIPMYTMTRPRPRAYAIGHKVNSFLSPFPFHSSETWLLPNTKTLHVLRNQGLKEKEQPASRHVQSFCQPRTFRPQPGTSGLRTFRPAWNLRPSPLQHSQRRANSRLTPEPTWNFRSPDLLSLPGTSGLPACRVFGLRPMYLFCPSLTPSWP